MAHFAKLGVNGKVIAVHGLDNDQMLNADGQEDESVGQQRLQQIHGWPAEMWIKTSYNTRNNTYYDADGSEGDQSKKLRGNSEINILLYNSLNYNSPNYNIFYIADSSFSHLPIIGDKFIRKSCKQFNDLIEKDSKDQTFYLLLNINYCDFDDLLKERKNSYKIDKVFDYKNYQFYFFNN